MSLFHSLYTSASGMEAQQRATSTISTNIANLGTAGFKRSDISFQELVGNPERRSGSGAANSVSTTKILRADAPGAIQQTSSSTDTAVTGNGFFAVRTGTDSNLETLYTRAGNFTPDATGVLRNAAGFVLHGWNLSQAGIADTSTLVPVDIDLLQTQTLPTTAANISLNLNAGEVGYDPHLLNGGSQLPVSAQDSHFSRSLTVFDTLGTAREVTMEFRKVVGPMAHFTTNTGQMEFDDVLVDDANGPTPGITAGDTLIIDDGTDILTVDFVNGAANTAQNEASTVQDVINVINNFTGAGTTQLFEARLTGQGRLLVQAVDPSATMDISTTSANVLGSDGLDFIQDPDTPADYTYEPDFDINADFAGSTYPDQGDFPTLTNTTNPNTQNWWEMTITIPDPSNPTGSTRVVERQGLLNFGADGALNTTADANGQILVDLASTPINFDNSITTEDSGFTIDITSTTQFTGNYNVLANEQNGAGIGTFTGIEINRNGIVTGRFSNGQQVDFYQIPLATFTNTNGLAELSGTAFRLTADAGEVTYNAPGAGGAGFLATSSIENSNVDLSGEFGDLILTQRAFSLNGQVLNAVDEMTRNLSQIA